MRKATAEAAETPTRWEFRCEAPQSGERLMAEDEELLLRAEGTADPWTVVRLYRWDRPTASIGRNQKVETALDGESCRRNGIPIVRRPTGGRAVLHADEITYAVVSNDPSGFSAGNLSETYRRIASALRGGLRRLGILSQPARVRSERRLSRGPALGRRGPCFEAVSRWELLVEGRKVAGSAQRRKRRAFLQHGSIPLSIDYRLMAEVLGTTEERLRGSVVSLSEAAARPVSWDEAALALGSGFAVEAASAGARLTPDPCDML